MNNTTDDLNALQQQIWQGSIPLQITLSPLDCRTYEDSIPYMLQCPRLSYLPFLLPRLHAFFTPALISPDDAASHTGWFSFDGVPLKWQLALGLLFDLFSPCVGAEQHNLPSQQQQQQQQEALPWKITLHYSDPPLSLIPLDVCGKTQHDNFINSVKEADFLRNGTGKIMMGLSERDSTALWRSVQGHDLGAYKGVAGKFYAGGDEGWALRHVPLKVYIPASDTSNATGGGNTILEEEQVRASVRVVQGLVPPLMSGGGGKEEVQTLGTALHALLPTVFPSRRSYIHAQAVLHGAVVPLAAPMRDLMQFASYADGFLHVAVVMVG